MSRADLLLLRKAVKEDWPFTPERWRLLLDVIFARVSREGTPLRLILAFLRFVCAVQLHNLELREAERKLTALQSLRSW
jgi:hypothetical protein